MPWYSKVFLVFGLGLGAALYSAFGLFIGNMARVKEGVIPLILYIPVILLYLILWVCHYMMSKHKDPLPISPRLILLCFLGTVIGMVPAFFAWECAGTIYLNRTWEHAKTRGFAQETPKAQPVDSTEENAVVWLMRAGIEERKLNPQEGEIKVLNDFILQASRGRTDAASFPKVKKILLNNRHVLDLIRTASRCPKVNWQPYGYDYDSPVPRFAYLLNISRLVSCQSIVAAEEGRFDDAAECIRQGLWLARTVGLPKIIIGDMIGVAAYRVVLDASQYRFERLPEKALEDAWKTYVNPGEVAQNLKDSLSFEYMSKGKMFTWGTTSFRKNPFSRLAYFFLGPFLYFDFASKLCTGEKFMAAFNLPFPQMRSAYSRAEDDLKKEGWIFAQIGTAKFRTIYEKGLASAVYLQTARLGLAARKYYEKHRQWPSSVEELGGGGIQPLDRVDPFNLSKIRLIKAKSSLLIYSVGPDLKDEKGLVPFEWKTEKGDIVFRISPPTSDRREGGP